MKIVNPVLVDALRMYEELNQGEPPIDDITSSRSFVEANLAAAADAIPPCTDVVSEDHFIECEGLEKGLRVRVYRPQEMKGELPILLWMHGGGLIMGSIEWDDLRAQEIVRTVNCLVVSVDYRLAPENPFPIPLEDCYSALAWVAQSAPEFGGDADRLAVGGASAGGGLAAGLSLLARSRAEIALTYQLLIYPMLDDTNTSVSSQKGPDHPVWNLEKNFFGWKSYLGKAPGEEGVTSFAAPFREVDLSGLPPAYICVGTPDLFLQENIEYARRLILAGVPTELHVAPDGFHAFDVFAPHAEISQRFSNGYMMALRSAFDKDQ